MIYGDQIVMTGTDSLLLGCIFSSADILAVINSDLARVVSYINFLFL